MIFNQTNVFVSQNQRISNSSSWNFEFRLPQILTQANLLVSNVSFVVGYSFTGFMTANYAINLIMTTSIQKMWGNLNVL